MEHSQVFAVCSRRKPKHLGSTTCLIPVYRIEQGSIVIPVIYTIEACILHHVQRSPSVQVIQTQTVGREKLASALSTYIVQHRVYHSLSAVFAEIFLEAQVRSGDSSIYVIADPCPAAEGLPVFLTCGAEIAVNLIIRFDIVEVSFSDPEQRKLQR